MYHYHEVGEVYLIGKQMYHEAGVVVGKVLLLVPKILGKFGFGFKTLFWLI